MDKYKIFLTIAKELNKIGVTPLLYGSLGLERRLNTDLSADDIDILITHEYLSEKWCDIVNLMNNIGYELYDLHEHAFKKDGLSAAFANIESLTDFADVNISKIPKEKEDSAIFFLLDLPDYLRVYKASSKDGYRTNKNNRKDFAKIKLIQSKILEKLTFDKISDKGLLDVCLDVIHRSFITVAQEFGLTMENCPSHTAFMTIDKLQNHLKENRHMYLLSYDGKPAGYFSLSESDAGFELNNLAVLPEFRHCGFGGKMLDKAKEITKTLGGEKITISVIEENEILKKWYKSNGFVQTGTKKFPNLPFSTGFLIYNLRYEEKL